MSCDMVGFHFRQEPNLNGEGAKLWNIYNFFLKDKQADCLELRMWAKFRNHKYIWDSPLFNGCTDTNIFHGSRISISVESSKSSHVTTASFFFKQSDLVIIYQPWILFQPNTRWSCCIDKCLRTFSEMTQFNYVCLKTAAKPSFINWWLHYLL